MEYPFYQLREDVCVLQGRTNTGIVKLTDSHCLLIDPGQDKDSLKPLAARLELLKLIPSAVLITHAHADHYGACYYLKNKTDISFYASEFESSLIEQPLLEPIFLFGGAEPIPELMYKFILAKPVPITGRVSAGPWSLEGKHFQIIDLSGHSPGQVGLSYAGLLFAGDSLTFKSFIDKYKFPFYSDIRKACSTLKTISNSNFDQLILGHGPLLDQKSAFEEIDFNLTYLQEFVTYVEKIVEKGPITEELLLKAVADHLVTPITTVIQFVLNRTLVLAALKYLQESQKVVSYIDQNQWLWKTVNS